MLVRQFFATFAASREAKPGLNTESAVVYPQMAPIAQIEG
jgi:hypothetical protein